MKCPTKGRSNEKCGSDFVGIDWSLCREYCGAGSNILQGIAAAYFKQGGKGTRIALHGDLAGHRSIFDDFRSYSRRLALDGLVLPIRRAS